ncbi:MAG: NAD-dependent epimerase/dehydratase family protein [Sphingomonas sp.]|nr:NAD-dependent epimerase/dehydratase family protein [Sphingomonas sp.]
MPAPGDERTDGRNRVLVTGANGFIGSHLVRRLLADGHEVHALLRPGATSGSLEGLNGLRRWIGGLDDRETLAVCLKGSRPTHLFHCAGVTRARHMEGWEPVREAKRVNVDGLANLLEAAAINATSLRSFVRLGGLEEYGNGPAPFVETQREAPRSAYSASQVAGTHLLQALQSTLPFPAVTLRPTLIYGPGQSTDFMIPALIDALIAGRPFDLSEGRQRRDLLHIDDLVTAMLAAARSDGLGGEIINIATGRAPAIRSVARAIARMIGRPDLLRFGARADRLNDIVDLRGDSSKARRLFGWRPTIGLAHGLARTIEWHRDKLSRECAA